VESISQCGHSNVDSQGLLLEFKSLKNSYMNIIQFNDHTSIFPVTYDIIAVNYYVKSDLEFIK